MNYSAIKKHDIANGTGVRVSLFVSGCRHHCQGCFNPETWDFKNGKPYTDATKQEILSACEPDYIAGLSVLGGEPFEPENISSVLDLLISFNNLYPTKTVWCYSGYKLEELWEGKLVTKTQTRILSEEETRIIRAILNRINVLVDGEFHIEEKDLKLRFRGSANQRLIDIPTTLAKEKISLKKLE